MVLRTEVMTVARNLRTLATLVQFTLIIMNTNLMKIGLTNTDDSDSLQAECGVAMQSVGLLLKIRSA